MFRIIVSLVAASLLGCGSAAEKPSDSGGTSISVEQRSHNDVIEETNHDEKESVESGELDVLAKSDGNKSVSEVDTTLLLKIKAGMTEEEVSALLGEPHKVSTSIVPAIPPLGKPERTLVSWTYNPGKDSFIVLLFENGLLENGESGGYSIKSGLKVQLPK